MLYITNTVTPSCNQWMSVILGMRNPKQSWEKSDSYYVKKSVADSEFVLGNNDKKLAMTLAKSGSEHAKYRRFLPVMADITAPVYWISEFDTYKIGTSRNSCSLQHTGANKDFTLEDFSRELIDEESRKAFVPLLDRINELRKKYLSTKNYEYFLQMRALIPMGYEYSFTISLNYEVLANIYKQRKTHKLPEWQRFCDWIKNLPYSELITLEEKE